MVIYRWDRTVTKIHQVNTSQITIQILADLAVEAMESN